MTEQEELWQSDEVEDEQAPRLTAGQYDLATIDAPEKKRVKPATELVIQMKPYFPLAGDRALYMLANKVVSRVGLLLSLKGFAYLLDIPGWGEFIKMSSVQPLTLATRIEQAAAHSDEEKRELQDILLELGKMKDRHRDAEQRVTKFLQLIHTSHPTMKKQIRAAAEQIFRAAHRIDPENWNELAVQSCETAWRDVDWRNRQIKQARVPSDTTKRVVQIMAQYRKV